MAKKTKVVCEDCRKPIPARDVKAYREVAMDPKALPATCEDCAEMAALNAKLLRRAEG